MARRVASGQLELSSPYPAGECTSESEAESIKEAFQHVRVQKSQHQQSYRWQTGDNVELWDLGSEDISEYEESDLESAFRSPGGKDEKQKIISSISVSLRFPADFSFSDCFVLLLQ